MTTRTRTPSPPPSSQRVGASPGGEASGLIDVRTLGAVLASDAPVFGSVRPVPTVDLPQFGGLSLTAAVQPPVPRAPSGPHAALPRSQGPMYALLGALSLAVLGLTGYVVASPPPPGQAIVQVVPIAAPQVEHEPEPEPARRPMVDEPAAAEPAAAATERARPDKPRPGKAKPTSAKEQPLAAVTPTPEPRSTPKPEPEYGVDCLLGKAACGGRSKPAPEPETPAMPSPSDLPEKLEQADISAGTSAARAAAASACAKLAKGGEKVQVKLSIAGPSGTVIAASPTEDAGNPQLAACCAGELKAASFRKVQKQQMGTVVTVKF
ncbi:MAG: hypothetical protein JNL82_34960 [Myxococcales bacterium]|nr:hypothetical protein [Myxococcales bacterium]